MATDFKYASQSDLEKYYPAYSQYDVKRLIVNWENVSIGGNSDIYRTYNTGLVTALFVDGFTVKEKNQTIGTSAITAVNESFSATDTTLTVDAATNILDDSYIKVEDEILEVTAISGSDLTVQRGKLATKPVAHANDTSVFLHFQPATNGDNLYDPNLDALMIMFATNLNNSVVEGGIDNATYFDQMLVNASMELNNLLDRRYATPIPKYTQYDANTAHVSGATEYDAIIIKSTCYICVANLLRTNNRQEEADYYNNLVTNMDGSGLIDRLNKGEYKLSFEVDAEDSKGKVRTVTKTGSMDVIETGGAYSGESFDLLRITCTTGGAYGTAIVKVEYYGSDKLFGSNTTDIKVTGGLQHIHGGWYCRFQGSSMSVSDLWEVEVYSETRKITNAESGGIQLTRRGYSI